MALAQARRNAEVVKQAKLLESTPLAISKQHRIQQ